MTTSNYKKAFKQLKVKPAKLTKFIKHNAPKKRSCGENLKKCCRCGRTGGHVSKYGMDFCRQCFREIATRLGFKKFN